MARVIFESPSASARVARASAWLAARANRAVTIVAASTDAAAEIARVGLEASGREGAAAALGWHRTTVSAFAAELARPELARLGLAPASALALEAICARVVHDHGDALGRLAPIRERPGLPRALARTLGELRLAGLTSPAGLDPAIASLLEAYAAELERARLADRARTLEIAAELAASPRREPTDVLFLDVGLRERKEALLVSAMASADTLAVIPSGDGRARDLFAGALSSPAPGAACEAQVVRAEGGPLARLQNGLFGAAETTEPVDGDGVTVLSAPGESRECVEIARLILAEATAGTPLD